MAGAGLIRSTPGSPRCRIHELQCAVEDGAAVRFRCARCSPARRLRPSSTSATPSTSVLKGWQVWRAMHAGDGTRQHPRQQRRLRHAADRARGGAAHHGAGAFARRVISGEHGTVQARVPSATRAAPVCSPARSGQDFEGRFHRGKAAARRHAQLRGEPGAPVYASDSNTPTRRAGPMGHESLIMQSDIGADCRQLRTACAAVASPCKFHVPRANLLYSPAQQDSGHLAADRSLPVSRSRPAAACPSSTGRSSRIGRPPHALPQVPHAAR